MIGSRRIGEVHMLGIGTRAPEFTLPDQDGRDTSLTRSSIAAR
jgi:peroxiredoxin